MGVKLKGKGLEEPDPCASVLSSFPLLVLLSGL